MYNNLSQQQLPTADSDSLPCLLNIITSYIHYYLLLSTAPLCISSRRLLFLTKFSAVKLPTPTCGLPPGDFQEIHREYARKSFKDSEHLCCRLLRSATTYEHEHTLKLTL